MMMLDSSIGKILSTTKPVEPSIPENPDKSETKNDSVATTTKTSEAEVRIVFRFFVEEQIVYNGKIEQVKQLESEELSRIVSRIAWDGAKDEKQLMLGNGTIENGNDMDIEEEETRQADCHSPAETSQPLDSLAAVRSRETPEKACDTPLENQDKGLDCIVPIDSVKTIINNVSTKTASSATENSICEHVTNPLYSYHICETGIEPNNSHKIQEKDKHQLKIEVQDQAHNKGTLLHIEATPTIQDSIDDEASAESQMIVEALNDCVNNVDLESRMESQKSDPAYTVNNEFSKHGQTQLKELDVSDGAKRVQQEDLPADSCKEVAKTDKKPLTEAANVPPNQDITQDTNPISEDIYLRDKDALSHQPSKDDLNLRANPIKKSDIILTSRRRNTCDVATTANRRIRRSGSKDMRASRVPSADTHGENSGQDDMTNVDVDHSSRLFAHQAKVFAKWTDNHFYPGTILKSARDRKFEIGFMDGARKDVVETDLIPLSNILCKQVRVSIAKDYCVNAIVHDQLCDNEQPLFDVSYQQNGMVRKLVPLRDIFLTAEQGIPLINQPIKPDKNPDESMFAGVDLDNIVHNKRPRRLQEMEDLEVSGEVSVQPANISLVAGRRKRGQYNTRISTNRARSDNNKVDMRNEKGLKRSHSDVNDRETTASSCSPDHIKPHLHSSNSNPPSESSSSTGSSNSAANGHDIGQEFYFESTSPHRTKTSLLS